MLEALERAGVRYAVIGDLAMAAHGFDRATRALDLFVPPDQENVERLRQGFADVFDDPDAFRQRWESGGEDPARGEAAR